MPVRRNELGQWVRADLPVPELVRRYNAGESTCKLGRAFGVAHVTIRERLLGVGVTMRPHMVRGERRVMRAGYPVVRDRASELCYMHRARWEAAHGPIPDGCVVHHKDGDTCNYALENLVCMLGGEHTSMHWKEKRDARDSA